MIIFNLRVIKFFSEHVSNYFHNLIELWEIHLMENIVQKSDYVILSSTDDHPWQFGRPDQML